MFLTTGEYTRGEESVLEEIPIEELDAVLCKFYAKVRRKDGEEYEPDSLALTRERYYQHSKIKFVSPRGHVMSSIWLTLSKYENMCTRKYTQIIHCYSP